MYRAGQAKKTIKIACLFSKSEGNQGAQDFLDLLSPSGGNLGSSGGGSIHQVSDFDCKITELGQAQAQVQWWMLNMGPKLPVDVFIKQAAKIIVVGQLDKNEAKSIHSKLIHYGIHDVLIYKSNFSKFLSVDDSQAMNIEELDDSTTQESLTEEVAGKFFPQLKLLSLVRGKIQEYVNWVGRHVDVSAGGRITRLFDPRIPLSEKHLCHSRTELKTAEELLKLIDSYNPGPKSDETQVMQAIQTAYQKSKCNKHALSRYLYDAMHPDRPDTVGNPDLPKGVFKELKRDFQFSEVEQEGVTPAESNIPSGPT
jgi:hypothetical protein